MKTRCVTIILLMLFIAGLTPMAAGPAGAAMPATAHAADTPWTWLSTRDGLAPGAVLSLGVAADGAVLIGTRGGLSLWNGRQLHSYAAGNGLAEGAIHAMAGQDDAVWAGSWGGGLAAYAGGRWTRYHAGDTALPADWISALAADNDGLWIATYGRGLARLEGDDWTLYRREDSPLPSDWLTALLPDDAGGLWVGTERAGLAYRTADGRWRRYPLPFVGTTEVTALARLGDEMWVGTPLGLGILAPATGEWRTLERAQGLPDARITALAAGAAHEMWIGTHRGLAVWRDGQLVAVPNAGERPLHAISALAVDSGGRLWVGMATGVAVADELALPRIERLPVVLVHGWHGPASDLLEDSEFWHLARWLEQDGFTPYYATGISPDNTLHRNARRLGEVIAQARRETGAPAVYLVGFSMGGLNSRAYTESTLYAGDVRRAFILGTPHRGEHLWETLLLWERLAWTQEPSALELLPVHATLFNRTHRNAYGVPYTLIAGDARDDPLPTLFRELPPGDGLVSAWSALGPEGLPGERRLTADLHAWGGDIVLLGVDSLLHPRRTYDAHIRPYLFGMDDPPAEVADAGPFGRPEIDPRTALRSGRIEPGDTVTLPAFTLEPNERARFFVRWNGGPLEVELLDPSGRRIDVDEAESADDVEFLELDFADFAGYVLTDTLPGPWSVVLSSDAESAGAVEYVAYVSLDSPVRLRVTTDSESYRAGDVVTIIAALDDPQGQATLNEVSVQVYHPDGRRETLRLSATTGNEGQVFTGYYRLPQQAGYYALLFDARGEHNGYPMERGAERVVIAADDTARLSGPATLRQTRDGDYVAEVGVAIRRAGHYLVAVALVDARGRAITTVAHPVELEAGEHRPSIPLPKETLEEYPGPYRVGEVLLMDISDAGILVDRAGTATAGVRPR